MEGDQIPNDAFNRDEEWIVNSKDMLKYLRFHENEDGGQSNANIRAGLARVALTEGDSHGDAKTAVSY
ncbi:hypothetical protein CSE16_02670 [Solibacillus sp. R5-41]|uniref:hypothetical protein n=1 Tax=Solibacillus sp. R5-41 TaxID=2048654 RepID=UPI000C124C0D|nr:hypothetical protein [Solibacillus sp. R5-41]ATP39012.1 hypothetical protein CSE16_02670 [Solibacillus sp. R5-41]